MHTAQEIYSNAVLALSASERLRLATLILEGLSPSAAAALDFSDQWSDDDLREITALSAKHAAETIGEE